MVDSPLTVLDCRVCEPLWDQYWVMSVCFAVSCCILLAVKGLVETKVGHDVLALEPGDDAAFHLPIPFEDDKALAELAGGAGAHQGDIIPVGKPSFKCVDEGVHVLRIAGDVDALSETLPGDRGILWRGSCLSGWCHKKPPVAAVMARAMRALPVLDRCVLLISPKLQGRIYDRNPAKSSLT